MREKQEDGGPFLFASQRPPTANAIDEDIYLTVTASDPCFPGQTETVDIILSIDYAQLDSPNLRAPSPRPPRTTPVAAGGDVQRSNILIRRR
jgi:hypothetical protein